MSIGKKVRVTVDRPLGSTHPNFPNTVYTVNYGYVEGILGGDGLWQDAYILGVNEPIDYFDGVVVARIIRDDDIEEKWVVTPEGVKMSTEEISRSVSFCEKYFNSTIVTE